jgi:hypothetical protein
MTLMEETQRDWPLGTLVRKKSGSQWCGRIVGYYSTRLTPHGVAIESRTEVGSVQIYPTKAIERF